MRCLVFSSLVVTSALSGCSPYYESQAKDLVQRQMDAMVFVKGGEFMMGNPGGGVFVAIPFQHIVSSLMIFIFRNTRFPRRILSCSWRLRDMNPRTAVIKI